tara:strand:+ start:10844 stop:12109 length:1266 start_codon:yes stop_codon:yes gene_type:complete
MEMFPYSKNRTANTQMVDEVIPDYVCEPSSTAELANIVNTCYQQSMNIVVAGGMTSIGIGNIPSKIDVMVKMDNLSEVLDFQPADLTVTVQAGARMKNLYPVLQTESKTLAIDGYLISEASIGGIISSNTHGFLRNHFGLVRDSLIGLTVMNDQGKLIKSGGRVVKNVTGYDMNKLYVGALGTLGIIVDATFKVVTVPANTELMVIPCKNLEAGIEQTQSIKNMPWAPSTAHVMEQELLTQTRLQSLESDLILIYLEGRDGAIDRKRNEILSNLAPKEFEIISGQDCSQLIQELNRVNGNNLQPSTIRVRANLPLASIGKVCESLLETDFRDQLELSVDCYFGTIDIHYQIAGNMIEDIQILREIISTNHGNSLIEFCTTDLKKRLDVWEEYENTKGLMRRVKDQFDCRNIFNRGRFAGGI